MAKASITHCNECLEDFDRKELYTVPMDNNTYYTDMCGPCAVKRGFDLKKLETTTQFRKRLSQSKKKKK